MKKQDFLEAIQVLTEHHSNEIIINRVEPNGQVQQVIDSPTIHVKNCVPAAVNNLLLKGFSLGMHNGLLTVDKY